MNGFNIHSFIIVIVIVDGLSGRAFAVIIALAFMSVVVLVLGFVYVHRARTRKLAAEQEETSRAVQEASEFLPR